MSLLASLVFVMAALAIPAALKVTIARYRDVALANVAALRECDTRREFRVEAVSVMVRPVIGGGRRNAPRAGFARRVRQLEGLRAAA